MIIRTERYWIVSASSNTTPHEPGRYPQWTAINGCWGSLDQKRWHGIWPHYHDYDELWLFTSGDGECWQDGRSHSLTPNTAVYNAMGIVHRFQMRSASGTVTFLTPSEGQKRKGLLLVEEVGTPQPTVPGFVIPGADNAGPFADRGSRCPLSELRMRTFAPDEQVDEALSNENEHWLVLQGSIVLTVEGLEVGLSPGDVALIRAGTDRRLRATSDASVAYARE